MCFAFLLMVIAIYESVKIRHNEDKVFKIGSSEICERRQLLKELQWHGLLKHTISLQIFQKLSSANFTWSILEYFVPTKAAAKLSLVIIRRLFRKVSQNHSENADEGALSSLNNSENTGGSTFLKSTPFFKTYNLKLSI